MAAVDKFSNPVAAFVNFMTDAYKLFDQLKLCQECLLHISLALLLLKIVLY